MLKFYVVTSIYSGQSKLMKNISYSDGRIVPSVIVIWEDNHSEMAGFFRAFWSDSPDGTTGSPVIGYCSPGGSHKTIRACAAEVKRMYPDEPSIQKRTNCMTTTILQIISLIYLGIGLCILFCDKKSIIGYFGESTIVLWPIALIKHSERKWDILRLRKAHILNRIGLRNCPCGASGCPHINHTDSSFIKRKRILDQDFHDWHCSRGNRCNCNIGNTSLRMPEMGERSEQC